MLGELRIDRRVERDIKNKNNTASNRKKLIKMKVKVNDNFIEKIVPYESSYSNILERYFGFNNVEIQKNNIGCIMQYCPKDSNVLYFEYS